MGDHQLVSHRGEDDPGDEHHVQIGVGVSGEDSPVLGDREVVLPYIRHGREVQPPEGCGRQEGHYEGYEPRRVEVEVGGGRAVYDDGRAEREDDEQAETLGEVLRSHVPGGGRETPPARYPVSHERRAVVERERDQPEQYAFLTV